jgi:hypothetical protein
MIQLKASSALAGVSRIGSISPLVFCFFCRRRIIMVKELAESTSSNRQIESTLLSGRLAAKAAFFIETQFLPFDGWCLSS